MIPGFAVLLLCQLAGEVTVRALGLPLPGPVLGLLLVVVVIALRARFAASGATDDAAPDRPVGRAADALLGTLSLLFVPAGVGVIRHIGLIEANALAIVATLVLSTVITLAVTVGTYLGVKRLMTRGETRP